MNTYDPAPHTHKMSFGNGNWVFFSTTHLGWQGRYSVFTAARDGAQVYTQSRTSLKDLFRWVREFEEYLSQKEPKS